MQRLVLGAVLVVVLAGSAAAAGDPIVIGESLTIRSKILGEKRTILVSPPSGAAAGDARYPVLYLTDGDAHLTHTRGTVDFLVHNGLMPDVYIVGIPNTDRTRDLTPSRSSLLGANGTILEFPTSGGASSFLDFIETELVPFIDSRYPTHPYRVLAGHSFGGLFALNALFTRPGLLNAVIAVGPTLRWDDDLPLRQAAELAATGRSVEAELFVTMADEEEDDPSPTRLDRLEMLLTAQPIEGLRWRVMRMPEESHSSAVLRAHYWGLRSVFAQWLLPTDPATGTFAGTAETLKAHYAGLSRRVGFPLQPPELAVNLAGYHLLGRGELEAAIEVFHYNVQLYPGSANVYDSLGEALERSGRLEEALTSYSQAVDRAKRMDDPRLELFTANRDRAAGSLAAAEPR